MKIFLLLAPLTLFSHFVLAQKSLSPLQDSINLYVKKNQPAKALIFAEEWQEKAIKEVGKEDTLYFMVTNVVGNLMNQAGKNKEAAPLMVVQAEEITKTLGPQNIYLAKCYQILGAIYTDLQEVAKSEECYQKSLELYRAMGKSKSNEEASIINNLGTLFFQAGQYAKAKPLYKEALQIWLQLFGENHKMVGLVYRNLGVINDLESNDAEAESYLKKSIAIQTQVGGENNPEVAMSLGNLGSHYFRMSNYPKAEECYQKSLDIRLKIFGENNNGVALMYTNLAMIQSKLGLFDRAIPGYMKSIDIRKKLLGEDHPRLADVYMALAVTYSDHGKLAAAEPYFEKALTIHQKKLGENHPTTATTLNNFGNLKYRMRKYHDAVKLYRQSLDIRLKVFGENNQYVASCYTNLGTIANDMGEFEKSNQYFRKAIAINLKVVGPYHQDMNVTQYQLARNLYDDQKTDQALAMLQTGVANSLKQIDLNFNILSENEKQDFFQNTLKGNLDVTSSLCFQMAAKHPQAIELLFNSTISTKALILNSTQKFRKRMANSPDSVLRNQYAQWEKNQQAIAAIYQKNDSAELKTLPEILKNTEILEKELVRKSADFAGLQVKKRPTWKTIQKKLKKEEAAIELIRLKHYGTAMKAVDSSQASFPEYQIKGLTDSVVYVAMIIKPSLKWPEMVVLPNGNEMENRHFFLYKNRIQNSIEDQNSYETYWKPIGEKLGPKVKQVFISPDGIFHSINLNTLWNPNSKRYLLEELEIRQLTNTKDLVTAKANLKGANYACLAGFPDFNLEVGKQKEAVERNAKRSETIHRLPPTRGEAFMELPGTKVEVEAIQELLRTKGWKVETLIGQEALEEAVKQTRNPGILHFATHGFFQTSKQNDLNPMLFSGLLLTGANRTFSGESVQEMEDGILTAYEAMNLNLDQTDLVVLSACETGLGEIKIGEGVYGLQRAFQVAGAKSIIMSLWKVDDEATKELMVSFYKNWLGPTQPLRQGGRAKTKALAVKSPPFAPANKSGDLVGRKRLAFIAAQKELKAKYPNPYYWGAFVMVGE